MNLPGLRPSRNDESHRQLNSHSIRAYCPGEATRRNERVNGQKTRSTSRRAGAQEAVVYLWCEENPLYLAANQPLNNHKNDHAAVIHAAEARDAVLKCERCQVAARGFLGICINSKSVNIALEISFRCFKRKDDPQYECIKLWKIMQAKTTIACKNDRCAYRVPAERLQPGHGQCR